MANKASRVPVTGITSRRRVYGIQRSGASHPAIAQRSSRLPTVGDSSPARRDCRSERALDEFRRWMAGLADVERDRLERRIGRDPFEQRRQLLERIGLQALEVGIHGHTPIYGDELYGV